MASRRTLALGAALVIGLSLLALVVLRPGGGTTPDASISPGPSASANSASPSLVTSPSASAAGSPSSSPTTPPSPTAAPTPSPSPTVPPEPTPTISGSDVSGDWAGTWTTTTPDAASGTLTMTLTQTGAVVDGTLTVEGHACFLGGAVQGTVDGNTVSLDVTSRDEAELEGTITGDRMAGTIDIGCDSGDGSWEVTRGSE